LRETLYTWGLCFMLAATPVALVTALLVTAPYGRHDRGSRGPHMGTRASWIVMEFPSSVFFAVLFLTGPNRTSLVPFILFALWELHYVHRTFIYPFQIRTNPAKRSAVSVVAMGFAFNTVNSYVNATWIGTLGHYSPTWITDPRFLGGVVVFMTGFYVNKRADAMLRNLRKPGVTDYVIPTGWLYNWISCPNYLGEILTWTGWALASWSLGGLAFALFTTANLLPRALSNHKWYREKFPDYPPKRRALVPFVL